MKISYYVKAKKSWSPFEHGIVKDAVAWGIKELNLENMGSLKVKLRGAEDGWYGDAAHLWDDKFLIRLSAKLSVKDLLTTIFHELVHVKQYAFDELEMNTKTARWRGEEIARTEYLQEPWEVEARMLEKQMLKKYLKSLKKCLTEA